MALKRSSVISKPHKTLNPILWDSNNVLKKDAKDFILSHLTKSLSKHFKSQDDWLSNVIIIGSNTTNQYSDTSDIDVDVEVNEKKFKTKNPKYKDMDFKSIKTIANENFSSYCDSLYLTGTKAPIHFHFSSDKSNPASDGMYDVLQDKWLDEPLFMPLDFSPEEYFKTEYKIAQTLMPIIKNTLVKSMKENQGNLEAIVKHAKMLHKVLKTLRVRRFIDKPEYIGGSKSINQDYRNVVFKFLEEKGYTSFYEILVKMYSEKEISDLWNKYHVSLNTVMPTVLKIEKYMRKLDR